MVSNGVTWNGFGVSRTIRRWGGVGLGFEMGQDGVVLSSVGRQMGWDGIDMLMGLYGMG